MEIWQAVFLGAVQGFTEFLPVSSSGHLILFQRWLGINTDGGFLFDVFLHIGTLIPVFIIFKDAIKRLFVKPFDKIFYLVLATVPAGITGFLFQDKLEFLFLKGDVLSAILLSAAFIFTASELMIAQRFNGARKNRLPLSVRSAFTVGLFQGLAIIPGISRSGTVLTGGTVARLNGKTNAEFTFLLSIPIISGAALLSGIKAVANAETVAIPPLLFGVATAALTGYISVNFMLKSVINGKYTKFSVYLIFIAAASVITKIFFGL